VYSKLDLSQKEKQNQKKTNFVEYSKEKAQDKKKPKSKKREL
jgi:hypothetical protein